MYTERQKKHHFFRAMLIKIHRIKMNYIWTHISYISLHETHLKNQRVAFVKNGEKWGEIAKLNLQKSQKLLAENLHERPPIRNIQ